RFWRVTDRNIGIATGAMSGFWVLDIDPGGEDHLGRLEAEHGKLPPTRKVITGSAGRHLWFKHTEPRCSAALGALPRRSMFAAQTVEVRHVHMHQGAQGVVGIINPPGEREAERTMRSQHPAFRVSTNSGRHEILSPLVHGRWSAFPFESFLQRQASPRQNRIENANSFLETLRDEPFQRQILPARYD